MNQNNILGHATLLMGGTLIMIIFYFIKSIRNLLKRQAYNTYNSFACSSILAAMLLKLNYEYYHPAMLLIPLITIIGYDVYISKKYKFLKTEFLPVIVLGVFSICISDRQVLTYFNPGLTEYNSNENLSWESFQGEPDIKIDKESHILPTVKYKFKEINGTNSSGVIICGIYKDSSWTRNTTNIRNLKVLEYYVKISEIYTRKTRKLFANENRKKQLLEKMSVLRAEYNNERNLYTEEVLESNSTEKYSRWKTQIDAELEKLKEFE